MERKHESLGSLYGPYVKGLDEEWSWGKHGGMSQVSNLDGEGTVVSFIPRKPSLEKITSIGKQELSLGHTEFKMLVTYPHGVFHRDFGFIAEERGKERRVSFTKNETVNAK